MVSSSLLLSVWISAANAALSLPFTKNNAIYRRDASGTSLVGNGLGYSVKFKIGGQDMESVIDTGSSDLWVPARDGCQPSDGGGGLDATCEFTYDSGSSSSFSANKSAPFNITYGDGSAAIGYYAQDTVVVGSATVSGANFAMATQASTNSVFGIGLPAGEVSYYTQYALALSDRVINQGGDMYENFPWQLYRQGVVSAAAYSLYLGSPATYSGELLFGGVDSSKYSGSIYTMPIDLEPIKYSRSGGALTYPTPTRFLVSVDRIAMTSSSGKTQEIMSGSFPALLDSGSTISTFPSSVAQALAAAFGVRSLTQIIGCGIQDGTVDITIRGQTFKIPFNNFVRTVHNSEGDEVVGTDGSVACSPGISVDDESTFFIFGDNILTALYVVFDLDKLEIGIAQANTNGGDANVKDIDSNGIPGATQASGYSSSLDYAFTAATELEFRVGASFITSVSGDVATRTTFNGDAESTVVRTRTRGGNTLATGSKNSAGSTGSATSGSGSSSNAGPAAMVYNGFAAFCAALLSL